MVVVIYTDASHNFEEKIAACGFVVLLNGKPLKHEVSLVELKKSSEAEIYAIVLALQWVDQNIAWRERLKTITIKTDHQAIILGSKKRKQYQELNKWLKYFQENGIFTRLRHVKGHGNSDWNNLVDESSRKQLRNYLQSKTINLPKDPIPPLWWNGLK